MKLTLTADGPRVAELDSATRTFLGGTPFRLGREDDNAWELEGEFVSRRHAEIVLEDGQFKIRDLHSANGTALNGAALEAMTLVVLEPGDQILIDDWVIDVDIADDAPPGERARDGDAGPTAEGLLAAFAEGLGIQPADLDPAAGEDVLRQVGELLGLSIRSMTALMSQRKSFRNDLGIGGKTALSAANNNPLKYGLSEEDVLVESLLSPDGRFLPLAAAMRECFDTLKVHDLALTAGVKVAIDQTLARLSPAEIEEQARLERRGFSSQDARCWSLYLDRYGGDGGRGLNADFIQSLADAYAKTVRQLETEQRAGGRE